TLANPPHYYLPKEETEFKQPESEQIKYVDSVFYVTSRIEEVEDAASIPSIKISVIKIQTAYRGYMARRNLRVLNARKRLTLLIQGQAAKRQMTSTLMRMQTMARVQSQARGRKIRMAEVNEALRRQLFQKREKELEKQRNGWDFSPKSKEQVEASLQRKKEAAERREKALAYAYSRQQTWRNSLKSGTPTFMDLKYPDWGWNWTERWNAIRPWETETTSDSELVGSNNKQVSLHVPSTQLSKALSSVSTVKGSRKTVSSPTASSLKVATKSMSARSRISNPGRSPLGSVKKGGSDTRYGMGLAKERHLAFNSSSSTKRSLAAPRKKTNTLR
uniref:protein IQ-DOMAIN 2-like n=1 Tax=Erigeron canadensis TaxID=72917 RepID=UPI001CB91C3B